MRPPVREFLMVDKCRDDYRKYLQIFNSNRTITSLDDEVLSALLTEEIERESYDYYANHFTKYNQDSLDEFSKSSERSTAARLEGNELLSKKKHTAQIHEEIWRLYSKSVALAPPSSEELCLAYSNRSYLFMHIGQFRESMKDIERAIALTASEALKLKLLCRKMTCLAGLKDIDGQKNTWNDIKTHYDSMDRNVKDQKLSKLVEKARGVLKNFQSSAPHLPRRPILPSHNLVSWRRDKKNGEYLIADRDVDPGELVMTFKPYAVSVNSKKFYAYCSHCLSIMWASIACDKCSLNMYCSKKCKTEAWETYHDIECKILPHMQIELLFYFYYQLAIRSLIMAVKEAGSLPILLERIEKVDPSPDQIKESSMEHRNIRKIGFMNLYNAPVNLKLDMFIQFLRNTTLILNLIIKTTDLHDTTLRKLTGREIIRDKQTSKQVIPSAVLILKLVCLAFSHHFHAGRSIGSYCLDNLSEEDCTVQRCCSRGALLVPGGYRVKSNCNPNTFNFIKEYGGGLIYFASQPIKKGDIITIAKYGFFYKEPKHDRQENMSFTNFKCACKACLKNWSLLGDLNADYLRNPMSPENSLIPVMLPKYDEIMEKLAADRNYQPSQHVLEELSRDMEEAFHVVGNRATFLTCLLMEYLSTMIGRLYSIRQPNVPDKCYL